MAPMDRRLRLWACGDAPPGLGRHAQRGRRHRPAEPADPGQRVTSCIFGKTAPGIVADATGRIPGPGGDHPGRASTSLPGSAQPGRPAPGRWSSTSTAAGSSSAAAADGGLALQPGRRDRRRRRGGGGLPARAGAPVPRRRRGLLRGPGSGRRTMPPSSAPDGPIGVMGESAGGTLSAVVCLLARDRGGPAISHQGLLYPATDMTAHQAGRGRTPRCSSPGPRCPPTAGCTSAGRGPGATRWRRRCSPTTTASCPRR